MSWESPQVECASPGWLPSTTLEGSCQGVWATSVPWLRPAVLGPPETLLA